MFSKFFRKYVVKTLARVEKRLRYVISVGILSLLMLLSTFNTIDYCTQNVTGCKVITIFNSLFDNIWYFVPVLIIVCYIVTFFSVLEDIEKSEWYTLFIMPVLVSLAFYFFYFLFPVRWITLLPFIIAYAISMYAMLSVSNIFNVGVEKSLQLYRAAFAVNYFYHTVVMFLLVSVLLSFKVSIFVDAATVFVIALVMALQLLWTVKPKITLEGKLVWYSGLTAFYVTQSLVIVSFIPLKSSIVALFVTACYYSLTGLLYHYLDQRLFRQTVREYLIVIIFVSTILLLTINW